MFVLADVCLDRPVLASLECFDLQLALDDHTQSRALHPARGQTALHFFPQQGREVETDEVIKRAARLLCADEVVG